MRTGQDAHNLAASHGFNLGKNFFAMDSETVERIIEAADVWRYRKPKNANGSRARYFYAYLNRLAGRYPLDKDS